MPRLALQVKSYAVTIAHSPHYIHCARARRHRSPLILSHSDTCCFEFPCPLFSSQEWLVGSLPSGASFLHSSGKMVALRSTLLVVLLWAVVLVAAPHPATATEPVWLCTAANKWCLSRGKGCDDCVIKCNKAADASFSAVSAAMHRWGKECSALHKMYGPR